MNSVRTFSTTAGRLFQRVGFQHLKDHWKEHAEKVTRPGGPAETSMQSTLAKVKIHHHDGEPVHFPSSDPTCPEKIVSMKCYYTNGEKNTFHLYADGGLTKKKGAEKLY
ncbi:hypothetical protein C7974DRAFT_415066 [Boeremia exigua]|uniref:uncharacterized protein n=1 Tax=Boeremia exigua TaxID=749465 RepID=UPI001E8D9B37|nr:uncharacterized protein C7974DRAFT_415066 [Boeremia exigua]KAH6622414.1 hypothetical protein C7974DRAFT_415066 [Boeremia exigua]